MDVLLLDFDGPLVDLISPATGLALSNSIVGVLQGFGLTPPRGAATSLFMHVWAEARKIAVSSGVNAEEFDGRIHCVLQECEVMLARSADIDADAKLILESAHSAADKVCIASNNSECAIREWLRRGGLSDFVDYVSGRRAVDSLDQLKPSPALLQRALVAVGCRPEAAMFIGDTPSDEISARAAGVHFLGFITRHSSIGSKGRTMDSAWRFKSRRELAEFLIMYEELSLE